MTPKEKRKYFKEYCDINEIKKKKKLWISFLHIETLSDLRLVTSKPA